MEELTMQAHVAQSGTRALAYVLAASSAAAMLYVGLYQSRAVQHLWCPVFGKGCEAVADAPFARPFGIPDGYIAAVLYGIVLVLLLNPVERLSVWVPLLVLVGLATIANAFGVRDMAQLGHFCFYCVFTTAASPVLFWAVWKLH
jgi:uncharacterized membrane protein